VSGKLKSLNDLYADHCYSFPAAEQREGHIDSVPYGQIDPRTSAYNHDVHLQAPMSLHRNSSQQGGALYYDQSGGYPHAAMATYDPTQFTGHLSTSSVGSRSSNNMEQQPISPTQAPFYSSPLPVNVQQSHQHMGAFHTPYNQYQQQPSTLHLGNSSTGYQVMRSMSGEMTSMGAMIDPHVHTHHAIATPMSPVVSSNQLDHGLGMDNNGSVYYQQYPSQASQYGSQQAYYPNAAMSIPGSNMSTAGAYPTMMTAAYPPQMQQQQQQYPSGSYAIYPAQYAASPYPNQHQSGAAYFHSGWAPSSQQQQQQQWRSTHYSNQPMSSGQSGYRRGSRAGSNSRSKGAALPMRPVGSSAATQPSSSTTSHDASNNASDSQPEAADFRQGSRPQHNPQQGIRSDHVLWCGNVPSDASLEELGSFFSSLSPDVEAGKTDQQASEGQQSPSHGVLSVFIIARSNCAFVNYDSPRHLERAVAYFHGQSLRPFDSRCPKLVCRVRKKDDEAQAGVAGQRGRGIHVAWVKEQDRKMKQKSRSASDSQDKQTETSASSSTPILSSDAGISTPAVSSGLPLISSDPNSSASTTDESSIPHSEASTKTDAKVGNSGISIDSSSGSVSYTSTSSSLFRHPAFHERFFILKSLGLEDLDRSVQNGLWATQPHNEQVLDQAYRNSESVYLIFSANQSGGFYGYAKMTSTILTDAERQQRNSGAEGVALFYGDSPTNRGSTLRPDVIPEVDEGKSGATLKPTAETSNLQLPQDDSPAIEVTGSPLPLTPAGESESPLSKVGSPGDLASLEQLEEKDQPKAQSPDVMLSRSSTVVPALTTTAPSGVVMSADEQDSPPLSSSLSTILTKVPVAMDENGVRRRDMIVDAIKEGSILSTLSNSPSLGPADSVSYDARTQQHLALRALIHNLRLEERESQIRAENLEKAMDDPSRGDSVSEADQLPKAASPDSFGRPFKVEWIKTVPLSFSHVRKLRNPWRDNRQVKVSRDGTELEPNTGRQLLKEWQRVEDESAVVTSGIVNVRMADDEDEDDDV
jgi:RNA recognition motif-containing protein